MLLKKGDPVRLKDYPNIVGTIVDGNPFKGYAMVRFPFSPEEGNSIRLDTLEHAPYQIKPGDLIRYKWNYTDAPPTALAIVKHVEDFDGATIFRAWTPTEFGDYKLALIPSGFGIRVAGSRFHWVLI